MRRLVDRAIESGNWLVLAGHGVGETRRFRTGTDMLEELLTYAREREKDLWLAPVGTVVDYVAQRRN